jgi:hypothetical protein
MNKTITSNQIKNNTLTMDVAKKTFKFMRGGIGAYINVENIPEGYVYALLNLKKNGEYDNGLINRAYRQGWSEVPADQHPELVAVGKSKILVNSDKNIIEDGDLILMKRPEEVEKEDRDFYQDLALRNQDIVNFATGAGVQFNVDKHTGKMVKRNAHSFGD